MQTLLLYTDRPSIKAPPYAIGHIWPIAHGTCVICNGPYVYMQQVGVVYISTRYSMTLQTGGNVSINYWHMCILRPGKWFSHWYTWNIFGISHRCWVSVKRGFCVSRKWCQSRKALPEVSHQEEKKNRTMYHTSAVQCDLHKSYAVSHHCIVQWQWVTEPSRSVDTFSWSWYMLIL